MAEKSVPVANAGTPAQAPFPEAAEDDEVFFELLELLELLELVFFELEELETFWLELELTAWPPQVPTTS